MHARDRFTTLVVLCALALTVSAAPALAAPPAGQGNDQGVGQIVVQNAVGHDTSPPLAHIPPGSGRADAPREKPLHLVPSGGNNGGSDGALQSGATGPAVGTMSGIGFAGLSACAGGTPCYAPPDTNGAVGATQYVQWVNAAFAVYDKANGNMVYGPVAGNTLWSGFGGGCEVNNDGDPIVQYDKAANRWIFTQFSVTNPAQYGYLQCVAVSSGPDAVNSTYARYAFSYGNNFPDYPKLGVWPDAYYITFNMFANGSNFAGAEACAYNRAAMLAGQPATQQCTLLPSYGSLLPADLDGATAPPPGSPNYLINYGANVLNLWQFHVDWTNPNNSAFTGPTAIPVASFSAACNGGTCIPQAGTGQKLDSLADRLMYRLAYRNIGGHGTLVVNHSVSVGAGRRNSATGIRWYELRQTGGTGWSVYQQGTYAPDTNYRWMGSIAMDKLGDIAVGYSISSGTLHPGIRYTGRMPSDALNTLEAEKTVITGTGSQLPNLSRWGDYSSMSVDPVNDCTFWYTSEYLQTSGTFNWHTQIVSFAFPGCA